MMSESDSIGTYIRKLAKATSKSIGFQWIPASGKPRSFLLHRSSSSREEEV